MAVVLEPDNSCPMQDNSIEQSLLRDSPLSWMRLSQNCIRSVDWSCFYPILLPLHFFFSGVRYALLSKALPVFLCSLPFSLHWWFPIILLQSILSWLLLFRWPELTQKWCSTNWKRNCGYQRNIFIHTQNNWATICLWKAGVLVFIYLFTFWLHWVLVEAHMIFIVAHRFLSSCGVGVFLSSCGTQAPGHMGSVVVVRGFQSAWAL